MSQSPTLLRVIPDLSEDASSALARLGWKKAGTPDVAGPGGVISVWEAPAGETLLSWISDHIADCEYFLIGGRDREAALESLQREIVFRTTTDLLTAIGEAADEGELGRRAWQLGLLACGPFDLEVFQVLAGLLNCRHPGLQRDALIAVGYAAWPEFGAAFDRLESDAESSEDVRAEAREVRARLEGSHWNAPFRE